MFINTQRYIDVIAKNRKAA